jgi:hypothetical protein
MTDEITEPSAITQPSAVDSKKKYDGRDLTTSP